MKQAYCYDTRTRIPVTGYEVETCVELPVDKETGEADYDSAKYSCRYFATQAEAEAYAKVMLPKDVWGAVQITPYCLEPYESRPDIYRLEYSGNTVYMERD